MLRTQKECRPCAASSQSSPLSTGPRASGVWRRRPDFEPVVSITTHHGAMPASARAIGFITFQISSRTRRLIAPERSQKLLTSWPAKLEPGVTSARLGALEGREEYRSRHRIAGRLRRDRRGGERPRHPRPPPDQLVA